MDMHVEDSGSLTNVENTRPGSAKPASDAFNQPPGRGPGSPISRPTALPYSSPEDAPGVPSHRQLKLTGVVLANWSHERVPCGTFVGQQCCHNMSLDDTRYLNPGGKTSFRAVFSHSWIGFLNRASQVRIQPRPSEIANVTHWTNAKPRGRLPEPTHRTR